MVKRHEEAARRLSGRDLSAEECLLIFLKLFARHVTPEEVRMSRKRREVLKRAGCRCEVPGCRSRCNLHVHHVVFRSHGGADELENYCVTCAAHHLRHIHTGRMRVEGEDPEDRLWEVGLDQDGEPYRVYQGDHLVYAWDLEDEETSRRPTGSPKLSPNTAWREAQPPPGGLIAAPVRERQKT